MMVPYLPAPQIAQPDSLRAHCNLRVLLILEELFADPLPVSLPRETVSHANAPTLSTTIVHID